jgi:hypothetical protein
MATSRSMPLTVSFGFLVVVRCAFNRRSTKRKAVHAESEPPAPGSDPFPDEKQS